MRPGWILAGVAAVVAASAAVAVLMERGGGEPAETSPAAVANDPAERASGLLEEAARLLDRGAGPEAEQAYSEALAVFREAELPAAAAEAAFGLGRASHLEGQSDDARRWYTDALALYGSAGRAADEARVLAAMGDLERNTFHPQEAARLYRHAREMWRAAPDPKTDRHPLLALESARLLREGEARARAVVNEAAALYGEIRDAEGAGDAQMTLGTLELALGNAAASAVAYRAAQERYIAAGAPNLAADATLRRARAELEQGYNIAVAATLAEASELLAAAGEAPDSHRVLAARGDVARQVGDLETAAHLYAEAATLVRLGEVEAARGNPDAARAAFAEAERMGSLGSANLGLGLLALAAGDAGAAHEHFTRAEHHFAEAGAPLGQGRAVLGLAEAAERLEPGAAVALYERAAVLFAAGESLFGKLLAVNGAAASARSAGDDDRFAELAEQARRLRQGVHAPVAEANRFLGLPATETIDIAVEDLDHHFGLDAAAQEALEASRAANLAEHPDHNREARDLVAAADATLRALLGVAIPR